MKHQWEPRRWPTSICSFVSSLSPWRFAWHRSPQAGLHSVLAHVASFWIEGDESSKKGLPIYESYGEDAMLNAGDGFLPMIADALQRLTAV